MIVDFYREVGYLPDAIINYLMLLGWSLDDKTEDFTREEMIKHFTLERVTKAPASFDPQEALGLPGPPHAAAAAQAEGRRRCCRSCRRPAWSPIRRRATSARS